MALIEKRGEHQWRARVRKLGFPDQSRTFNHRRDAERWAKETELRIERGEFISTESQRTTFEEVATR
ncbi:MAG TPA: site-specific integrase, partial [Burkholderiaceae bacterium]